MSTIERRRARALAVAALLFLPRSAAADDRARAESLFQEARELMGVGRFAEACPRLAQAQALNGGGGTLLALAMCHEGEGKLATALAEFREAHALATRASRSDRVTLAEERIRSLEPRVSRVVPYGAPRDGSVVVELDGVPLRAEHWSAGAPVDGGAHELRATAAGKSPWHERVEVAPSGQTLRVAVPELSALPEGKPPPSAAKEPPAPSSSSSSPPSRRSSPLFPIGIAAGAVGLGAVAVGTYFGVAALNAHGDARGYCQGTVCEAPGVSLNDDAKRDARIADVAIGAGVVLAAVGVVLVVLSAPAAADRPPPVAWTGRGLRLSF
jgi:hypothetical protein